MKTTLIGDPSKFAIESCITHAYARLGIRALGYFSIYVGNHTYGVREPDATMLACSFDEVHRRILRRGNHTASFSTEPDANLIAFAINDSIFGEGLGPRIPNVSAKQLKKIIYPHHLLWAPDGDEAFDDGSRILHFDVDERVRLIAFRFGEVQENGCYPPDPASLSDLWLDADEFYSILKRWVDAFEAEWAAAPKKSEDG